MRALTCCDGIIATGGDDGAIKVWKAKDILLSKKYLASTSENESNEKGGDLGEDSGMVASET